MKIKQNNLSFGKMTYSRLYIEDAHSFLEKFKEVPLGKGEFVKYDRDMIDLIHAKAMPFTEKAKPSKLAKALHNELKRLYKIYKEANDAYYIETGGSKVQIDRTINFSI